MDLRLLFSLHSWPSTHFLPDSSLLQPKTSSTYAEPWAAFRLQPCAATCWLPARRISPWSGQEGRRGKEMQDNVAATLRQQQSGPKADWDHIFGLTWTPRHLENINLFMGAMGLKKMVWTRDLVSNCVQNIPSLLDWVMAGITINAIY